MTGTTAAGAALAGPAGVAGAAAGAAVGAAIGRRMDRQGSPPSKLALEQAERVARIVHAVDAMSIEVERLTEGQRFVTKLLTERALPEGQAADALGARRADPLPAGGERR